MDICDSCNRLFYSKGNLQKHIEEVHKQAKVMNKLQVIPQEAWLSKSLPNLEDLLATIPANILVSKEEELDSKKDFENIMCEVRNVKVQAKTNKNNSINCEKCRFNTTSSENLKIHIENVHEPQIFKCDLCSFYTFSDHGFKIHQKLVHPHEHTKDSIVMCDVCGNNYKDMEEFKSHMVKVHHGEASEAFLEDPLTIVSRIFEGLLEKVVNTKIMCQTERKNMPVKQSETIRGGGPTKIDKSGLYTTTIYPETDNKDLMLGLTIKGTSEDFKTAHAKISLLISKVEEDIHIDKITLRVVEKPFERGCVKAVVQLTLDENTKGKAVLKLWNVSKKGGTIQITRFKGESFKIVESLAKDVINVLIEDSQTETNNFFKELLVTANKSDEENIVKRLETNKHLSGNHTKMQNKAFKCDMCNVERASKNTLNNHKSKMHKGTITNLDNLRQTCDHCDIEVESNRKLRIHHIESHIGAIPGFNQLAGSKRSKLKKANLQIRRIHPQ